jgi:hypothetical protein
MTLLRVIFVSELGPTGALRMEKHAAQRSVFGKDNDYSQLLKPCLQA